jgi:hypothetical protein
MNLKDVPMIDSVEQKWEKTANFPVVHVNRMLSYAHFQNIYAGFGLFTVEVNLYVMFL